MRSLLVLFAVLSLSACAGMSAPKQPTPIMPSIELPRFMGSWYVIAAIPLYPEREAFNAIETYTLQPDRSIKTDFRMRKGSFDAPVKVYHPTGYVVDGTGDAVWGMQFLWPFKGEYRIAFVEPDYSATIVARNKRDYVWLMARTPQISDAAYVRYEKMIADMGYDVAKIRKVPQQWPEK
ncbi:lipocalin family protein [Hydrocarboniphaga sp.]|uniref:lipocalin family protein n=1 Tax=Hydrocarboniphaga sp. TaxID=2033016 RepID=UPI003D0A2125